MCCSSDGVLAFPVAGVGVIVLESDKLVIIHLSASLSSKNLLLFYSESALGW